MPVTPWWKNSRGELFVIAQFVVIALVALAPRTLSSLPEWSSSAQAAGKITGGVLLFSGTLLAAAGALKLGRNLTPFICPKANAVLLDKGAYGIVRHPIYAGILQMACGWGLWIHGWLTLCYVLLLFMVFDRKSRREEEFLRRFFPEYDSYSRRVKRLIPFIY
jgi:protein-S-isoprenylcysteine O-methyltransferase Ste14